MRICWDNIENIRLTKNGNFRDVVKKKTYKYIESCKNCGEPFLSHINSKSEYCCNLCHLTRDENFFKGKHHTEETRKIMSAMKIGKPLSDETKKKMSRVRKGKHKGEEHHLWNGYYQKGIPIYDTFKNQLEWCEEVRRSPDDKNVLEVKCFKCGKWFVPRISRVYNRIQSLKGQTGGYCHFYCSEECKHTCSVYNKSPQTLMKEDAVRAGKMPWLELDREVQHELRQMVLERDNYTCQKCGSTENLQCHHILPVAVEPLLSADVDNCITLCYNCHRKAHKQDGCRYGQLRNEVC